MKETGWRRGKVVADCYLACCQPEKAMERVCWLVWLSGPGLIRKERAGLSWPWPSLIPRRRMSSFTALAYGQFEEKGQGPELPCWFWNETWVRIEFSCCVLRVWNRDKEWDFWCGFKSEAERGMKSLGSNLLHPLLLHYFILSLTSKLPVELALVGFEKGKVKRWFWLDTLKDGNGKESLIGGVEMRYSSHS